MLGRNGGRLERTFVHVVTVDTGMERYRPSSHTRTPEALRSLLVRSFLWVNLLFRLNPGSAQKLPPKYKKIGLN